MSAPWELNHPDDFIILTVDVADSPIAELRLSEIYDEGTSTMNDDYLVVLQDYVALQVKTTVGLCDRSKISLLSSRFILLHCRTNGDVISLRKPAMERLIRQTLQSRLNNHNPACVSIMIQFKALGFRIPRRLHESPHIPPKICGIATTNGNFGGSSHATRDAVLVCALLQDLNVEPMASHADFVHDNTHIVTGMADEDCIELSSHNKFVITAVPKHVGKDAQHACPNVQLQQHLAGNTPNVDCIPSTADSTRFESLVTREPGTYVLVQTCLASNGDAPRDSARTVDNCLYLTANTEATVTLLRNTCIDSPYDHINETVKYHLVDCGRFIMDLSKLAPFLSPAQVVANNFICERISDTLPGITTQAGAARNTDKRSVRRIEHVVNTMPAPLASIWLPVLLKYQPIDRGRHFCQVALMRPTSVRLALY